MPTHRIMTAQDGDKAITFDTADPVAVQEAMERFNDLVKNQKHWATKKGKDGAPDELMREFDPEADVIFSPQLVGG